MTAEQARKALLAALKHDHRQTGARGVPAPDHRLTPQAACDSLRSGRSGNARYMHATIRPPLPADQGYIAKTWSRSMASTRAGGHAIAKHGIQRTAPVSKGQRRQDELATHNRRIDAVLDRPDTRALVAVQAGNGHGARDYILAWVVYVDAAGVGLPIVHYAYTRDHNDDTGEQFRERGLVRSIFERIGITRAAPVICTSSGPSSDAMRERFRASTYFPLDQFLSPTRRP